MPTRTDPACVVAGVRLFNRFYTQLMGVLAEGHLGCGLPLGQARVLFELGQLGAVDMHALRSYLGLDAGYLSRMLSALEQVGLIRTTASARDGRVKDVTLTRKGKDRLAQLDRRSDALVEKRIERLPPADRGELLACVDRIRRLLGEPAEIVRADPEAPGARACLAAYFAELDRRFPHGFEPSRSVSADADEVTPPRGAFLVVMMGGLPRGCGAVKTLEPGAGEIKRMWLHPELRGRGMGRALLDELENESRALGHRVVRLDTSVHLKEAIALYAGAGYVEIPAYNDNRYAAHWFEKRLGGRTRSPHRA